MHGYDRNWERLCLTLEGFRARHGAWPKRVRMFPSCLDELRLLFRPSDFTAITSKVELVAGDAGFFAENDTGQEFDYAREIDNGDLTGEQAHAWLGVKLLTSEELFGWEENPQSKTAATDPFALQPGQWYAMERWGIYSLDDPYHSPVRIKHVRPWKDGQTRVDVAFYHASQSVGRRNKEYTLRWLHRGRRWLVALQAHAPEEPVFVLFPLTARWLKERVPGLLRRITREPLALQLDRFYKFDQENAPVATRTAPVPSLCAPNPI